MLVQFEYYPFLYHPLSQSPVQRWNYCFLVDGMLNRIRKEEEKKKMETKTRGKDEAAFSVWNEGNYAKFLHLQVITL